MTIKEWADDFKSYVNELQMLRDDYRGIMEYIDDGYALLQEQEPVNPIRIVNDNNFLYDLCGFCGKTLPVSIDYDRARYCPFCGKKVKWE